LQKRSQYFLENPLNKIFQLCSGSPSLIDSVYFEPIGCTGEGAATANPHSSNITKHQWQECWGVQDAYQHLVF
jgi:hypothetical protein